MAPLWSLGLGWALRLVWAKVVGPIEHATSHHVPRLEAQGPTSLRPCTRGIIAMDFNEQWVWRGVAPHTPTIHIFLDLSNFYELLIQDIEKSLTIWYLKNIKFYYLSIFVSSCI